MASSTSSPHFLEEKTSTTAEAASSGALMAVGKKQFVGAVQDEWQMYSDRALDYTIGAPIGFGASSIVYSALYYPPSNDASVPSPAVPCALKVLDLDLLPRRALLLLQRETTLMSLSKHPNVLRVRGSWMNGCKLYISLRLMNRGSAADIMRYGWPDGFEEGVIRCILAQALKGLNYLHVNGFIHRDIKAANMLIDDDGTVLLGDLGVAADLAEDMSSRVVSPVSDSRQHGFYGSEERASPQTRPPIGKRKSFVGTPCWMAPELIQGRHYDSSADIWSFAITALELTQGRPPRSRVATHKVLMNIIQDDPPTLNRDGKAYKYSRTFKEMIDSCLVKDPSKRPSAQELLQHPFFKSAKKKSYLVDAILKDLPPLALRQERRITDHVKSHHSMDSWDFASTVTSKTSIHYPKHSDPLPSPLKELKPEPASLDVYVPSIAPSYAPSESPSESLGSTTVSSVIEGKESPHAPQNSAVQLSPQQRFWKKLKRSARRSTS